MRHLAVIVAALCWLGAAHAVNISFMKDAPITRLDAEELKTFRAFISKTLDETPDGTTVEWKARKTSFSSKVTPLSTSNDGGMKCRQTRIESDAADRHARGNYDFCKKDKGDWQFKTAASKPKAPSK